MFSNQNIKNYILPFAVILGVSMFSDKIKEYLQTESDRDDYYFVRKYLLNDVSFDGKNKPIIWIYSNYEMNSRKWSSFHGRRSKELNQPYLIECVQSVINKCGDKFNICLIDDDSFSKLLPEWNMDISNMVGCKKQRYIQLGLLKLIYKYGGINIPNSFLCISNLDTIYNYSTYDNVPFFFEKANVTTSLVVNNRSLFTPGLEIYGCQKGHKTIKNLIDFYQSEIINKHDNSAYEFEGYITNYLTHLNSNNHIIVLNGALVGVKTEDGKHMMIEDLLSESKLPLEDSSIGILIPANKLLERSKYNWFSVSTMDEIYNSNLILGEYFKKVSFDSADMSNVKQI